MSFTIGEALGYKQGSRYEKKLRFVKEFGNSKRRYVVFKDEEGNVLHWTTNDSTKVYQNLKKVGTYRFTIDYIIAKEETVIITRLALKEGIR